MTLLSTTTTPFTMTYGMPSEYWAGLSKVALSMTVPRIEDRDVRVRAHRDAPFVR